MCNLIEVQSFVFVPAVANEDFDRVGPVLLFNRNAQCVGMLAVTSCNRSF